MKNMKMDMKTTKALDILLVMFCLLFPDTLISSNFKKKHLLGIRRCFFVQNEYDHLVWYHAVCHLLQ